MDSVPPTGNFIHSSAILEFKIVRIVLDLLTFVKLSGSIRTVIKDRAARVLFSAGAPGYRPYHVEGTDLRCW